MGHGQRVVAGGGGHDAASTLFGREVEQLVGCATQLERAGMLAAFQLEKNVGAGAFGQGRGREQRCLDDMRAKARCGQLDLVRKVRDRGAHSGSMALHIFRSGDLHSAIILLASGRRSHLLPKSLSGSGILALLMCYNENPCISPPFYHIPCHQPAGVKALNQAENGSGRARRA